MKQEKIAEIAKAMNGLSYRDFLEVTRKIDDAYHVVIKKKLSTKELKNVLRTIDGSSKHTPKFQTNIGELAKEISIHLDSPKP